MRPNISVTMTNAATTTTLRAIIAGKNWIFAIHPRHVCSVPVKSRKSKVIHKKKITASVCLILRNIAVLFYLLQR